MQFTSSMYSNVTTSTRINSSMYIRTSFVCSSLHVSSIRIYILITGFVDPKCNNHHIGPELQERAEIHPCLLGLGADTFLLVYRIPGVFRDGELDSLADHKWPPTESRNFRDGGVAQFQEFGSPVNEGQHFNGGTLGPSPEESHGVDLRLVFCRINLIVSFF